MVSLRLAAKYSKKRFEMQEKTKFFYICAILSIMRVPFAILIFFFIFQRIIIGAFIIFLIAALSDILDGKISRKSKQDSRLGWILENIVDNVLFFFTFLSLALNNYLPYWFFSISLMMIFIQLFCFSLLARDKNRVNFDESYYLYGSVPFFWGIPILFFLGILNNVILLIATIIILFASIDLFYEFFSAYGKKLE